MRIYSLFDRKVKEYGQLVLSQNDEAVKRSMLEGLQRGNAGTVGQYPEDFDLMCLGVFDPERGRIVPEDIPFLVVNVAELIPTSKPEA